MVTVDDAQKECGRCFQQSSRTLRALASETVCAGRSLHRYMAVRFATCPFDPERGYDRCPDPPPAELEASMNWSDPQVWCDMERDSGEPRCEVPRMLQIIPAI